MRRRRPTRAASRFRPGNGQDPAGVLLVLTSCPDAQTAERLRTMLVERRLAACVNQLPAVVSTYRWKGAVEHAAEFPLLIKTTRARYPALQDALRSAHPYELPEIVAFSPVGGLAAYLDWIAQETRRQAGSGNDFGLP
jgi:periplasmic divalent cation tolerance protein